MKIIDKKTYLELESEDTYAVDIYQGEVVLLSCVEYNQNTDEENYTEYRINEFSWKCGTPNGRTITEIELDERANRCGGILLVNSKTCFVDMLEYAEEPYTIILFDSMEETAQVMPVLKDGSYIFVVNEKGDECNEGL